MAVTRGAPPYTHDILRHNDQLTSHSHCERTDASHIPTEYKMFKFFFMENQTQHRKHIGQTSQYRNFSLKPTIVTIVAPFSKTEQISFKIKTNQQTILTFGYVFVPE